MEKNEKRMVNRVVIASLIGATIEWYDFFLYGVIAGLVFNKLYLIENRHILKMDLMLKVLKNQH